MAIETTPAFLRGLGQFEDYRERRPVGQAILRLDRAVAHGSEGAFNGIGNRYEDGGASVPEASDDWLVVTATSRMT